MQPPAQELIAKDLHDSSWKFRHIYRGTENRRVHEIIHVHDFVLYMDANCYADMFCCQKVFGYIIYVWPFAAITILIFSRNF